MKKPEYLNGFVMYDEAYFPFHFDDEHFKLVLYPPTMEDAGRYPSPKDLEELINGIFKLNKKHEYIPTKTLNATSLCGEKIAFQVQDNRTENNGIISFKVNWYICYEAGLNLDKISGFIVEGNEIDKFYPPNESIKNKITDSDDNHIRKLSILTDNIVNQSCGQYNINENNLAKMSLGTSVCHSFNKASTQVISTSYLKTNFKKPTSIDTLIDAVNNLQCFLKYITYRHNVNIGVVKLLSDSDDKVGNSRGFLVFHQKYKPETYDRKDKQIIEYKLLQDKAGKLFNLIAKNKIEFNHLCESIDDRNSFSLSRIIMVCAAFEREYRNIYGEKLERSAKYQEFQDDILSKLKPLRNDYKGKKKKYLNTLIHEIEKEQKVPFGDKIRRALIEHKPIMSGVVEEVYNEGYQDLTIRLVENMTDIRNSIAHSLLDLKFEAINIEDIKTVEKLTYAMRLKNMDLSDEDCRAAITCLFKG